VYRRCTAADPYGWTVQFWRNLLGQVQAYVLASQPNVNPPIPMIWGVSGLICCAVERGWG